MCNYTPISNTLIGVIAGGVFGIIGGYFSAVRLANLNAKRLAAIELRKAFMPVLVWLKSTDWHEQHIVSTRLEAEFLAHSIAVDQFGIYLNGNQLRDYNKAWLNYYGHDADKYNAFDKTFTYMQHFRKYYNRNDPDGHNVAIENIENILKYATPSTPKHATYPFNQHGIFRRWTG